MSEAKHAPEPWGDPYQREEPHGYMGDCAIVPLDDYDHARRCVNALAGLRPEAVAELVEAARHWIAVEDGWHADNGPATTPIVDAVNAAAKRLRASLAALEVER
jgi:hypothetical protein